MSFLLLSSAAGAAPTAPPSGAAPSTSSYPACTGKVSGSESEAAHKIYLAGRVQYDDSNWDAAISQFREAYRRDCTKHELLIILSRAYEAKGERREARLALQTFLDRVPDSPDATALRSRLANIDRQIAKDDEKARAAREPEPAQTPASTEPAPAQATLPAPPPAEEHRGHTVLPWVVTGLGVAALTTGIVLLATAPDVPATCSKDTGKCQFSPGVTDQTATDADRAQKDRDRDQANESVTMNVAGTVTAIAGGALVVGGLLWHFLEPTGPKHEAHGQSVTPTLRPIVGLHTAGLALGGAF